MHKSRIFLDLLPLILSQCIDFDLLEDSEHAFGHLPSFVEHCKSASSKKEHNIYYWLEHNEVHLILDIFGSWNSEH